MSEKVCTGHYCQGKLRPLTEFYVHKSGYRKGKPFSRCKRCWRWQVDHPQGSLRDLVPMQDFREVLDELVRRVGQTNAARRIGVAVDTISRRRLAEKDSVRPETHERALAVLEEARRNGEDGWDIEAVRKANLTPERRLRAGQRSGEVRRALQWDRRTRRFVPPYNIHLDKYLEACAPTFPKELADKLRANCDVDWTWQEIDNYVDKISLEWEHGMDMAWSERSWGYPDKEGRIRPFADFECKHGRLSGDKTPACGCWPGEQV